MSTRFARLEVRTLVANVMSAILLGLVGALADAAEETVFVHSFTGEVDEDLFIGLMVSDPSAVSERRDLLVYLCDGADVSIWFFGEATGDSAVVEAGDALVRLSLGDETVFGVVERTGGSSQAFVADRATGDAGLYRAVETFDGREYVGGWIVLDDARQRGAITLDGVVVENPSLHPPTGEAETSLGTFGSNCFINPRTGERICRYLN